MAIPQVCWLRAASVYTSVCCFSALVLGSEEERGDLLARGFDFEFASLISTGPRWRDRTTTHDQTEALALSDRIAVLSHGRIEQIGTPSEIYERPASAFVADFIGSSNVIAARIVERGKPGTIVETATGLRLCCGPDSDGGA